MAGPGTHSSLPASIDFDPDRFTAQSLNALTALRGFREARTGDAVWDVFMAYADTLDADLLAYHHHAPPYAPDHENMAIRTRGFPSAWVKTYIAERMHRIDPITRAKDVDVRPVRWSEVERQLTLTPAQLEYMRRLREWMTGDGMGLPAYGPSGRAGYIGIGRAKRDIADWDILQLNRLQWVAQSFHLRMCEIALLNLPRDFSLTDRELTILRAMALGLSDSEICALVGARLHSVKSSIARMLKKMSVSDRPSAVLRARGAGLLTEEDGTSPEGGTAEI